MKKVVLLGHKGSIGRRYATILDHLSVDWVGVDVGDEDPKDSFTHAIVATPSNTHYDLTAKYSQFVPVLCEKPLATSELELVDWKALIPKNQIYMVNNYTFLNTNPGFPPRVDKLEYSYFNTGKDGTALDCIQLLYLAKKISADLEIRKTSPTWQLWINDSLKVPYEWIEWSYVQMINSFVNDRSHVLWPLSYGLEATELALSVHNQMENKHAGFTWNSGKVEQYSSPSKNLRKDRG